MKTRRLVTIAFLLAFLNWPLVGCSLIVPRSDGTRPQVKLAVFGLREDPFTIESATTLTVPRGWRTMPRTHVVGANNPVGRRS